MTGLRRARSATRKTIPAAQNVLFIRVNFSKGAYLGPGKIELLERIDAEGSIASAGKQMGMSYKRAWYLVDEINHLFVEPLVVKKHGGTAGGGAVVTPAGRQIITHYREIQRAALEAAAPHLDFMSKLRKPARDKKPTAVSAASRSKPPK